MGMPLNRGGIISRTDPRYQPGGLQQAPVAPPPVDPAPMNTAQPIRPTAPVGAPVAAAGVRVAGSKANAPGGSRRGAGVTGFTTRRASTPPWLQRAVPSGALIGG